MALRFVVALGLSLPLAMAFQVLGVAIAFTLAALLGTLAAMSRVSKALGMTLQEQLREVEKPLIASGLMSSLLLPAIPIAGSYARLPGLPAWFGSLIDLILLTSFAITAYVALLVLALKDRTLWDAKRDLFSR